MKQKKDHLKINKEEDECKFKEYCDIDEEETEKRIIEKLDEFPIHKLLQELSLNDLLRDFDAISLYPSAMGLLESFYLRIETDYAYTPNMNDELVEKFNNQTFTQGSAFFKKI